MAAPQGSESRKGHKLRKLGEEGFHFGAGVGVAFAGGDGDAGVEDGASFVGAGLFDEELGVHEVSGHVFDVALEEFAKVEVGVGCVSRIGTFKGETVAGERVVGFFGDELFEQLAAGFLLFGHSGVRIIAGDEITPKLVKQARVHEAEECGKSGERRRRNAEGEDSERFAVGDGGSGVAGGDEFVGEAAGRARDASGGRGGGDGGESPFEQLCGDSVGGLHRFSQPGEPGRDCAFDVAGESRVQYVDGSGREGVFGKSVDGRAEAHDDGLCDVCGAG